MLFINEDGTLDEGPASEELALSNLQAIRDNGEFTWMRMLADAVIWLRANP